MNQVPREMLFGDIFNDLFEVPLYRMYGTMKTDVYDQGDHYVMETDMPGFKKEDVTIDYNNGYLTVSAKKEKVVEDKNFVRRERYYGELKRSYYVGEIDESLIKANFEDGILKLVVPKSNKELQSKKIIDIE